MPKGELITEQFVTLAKYNRAMNQSIYAAAAELSEQDRKLDRGAFFGSIHRCLNHILLVDRLWLGRIVGKPENFASLDQELYSNFETLRAAHFEMGERIEVWANTLTEQQLGEDLIYVDMAKNKSSCALWIIVTHFFNHQAHHRGQITTLLTQAGIDVGVTDLPYVLAGLVSQP